MGVVTSLFVRKMIAAAGDAVDQNALLDSIGLDPTSDANVRTMVSAAAYYSLLERIADQIDVTDLPLKTGASMHCDDYGALGLAFKAASTLEASYKRIERYARLWTSVVEYELRPADGGTFFILHRSGPRRLGLRLSNEATLASAVSIARQVSPVALSPLEVHVKHSAPKTVVHHERYFGCNVIFDSELDAILYSDAAMKQPNRIGDEGISRYLLGHLDGELNKLSHDKSLEELAKDALADSLSEGLPKMEDIARRLGLSVRSLHRRLAEEGLNFQSLTETTRRELAEGLLGDERYSLAEIAFLTGFSEQSSFSRAFKRWAGNTPATFRRGLLEHGRR
jgi:AraC-like DNA-binding protein